MLSALDRPGSIGQERQKRKEASAVARPSSTVESRAALATHRSHRCADGGRAAAAPNRASGFARAAGPRRKNTFHATQKFSTLDAVRTGGSLEAVAGPVPAGHAVTQTWNITTNDGNAEGWMCVLFGRRTRTRDALVVVIGPTWWEGRVCRATLRDAPVAKNDGGDSTCVARYARTPTGPKWFDHEATNAFVRRRTWCRVSERTGAHEAQARAGAGRRARRRARGGGRSSRVRASDIVVVVHRQSPAHAHHHDPLLIALPVLSSPPCSPRPARPSCSASRSTCENRRGRPPPPQEVRTAAEATATAKNRASRR